MALMGQTVKTGKAQALFVSEQRSAFPVFSGSPKFPMLKILIN